MSSIPGAARSTENMSEVPNVAFAWQRQGRVHVDISTRKTSLSRDVGLYAPLETAHHTDGNDYDSKSQHWTLAISARDLWLHALSAYAVVLRRQSISLWHVHITQVVHPSSSQLLHVVIPSLTFTSRSQPQLVAMELNLFHCFVDSNPDHGGRGGLRVPLNCAYVPCHSPIPSQSGVLVVRVPQCRSRSAYRQVHMFSVQMFDAYCRFRRPGNPGKVSIGLRGLDRGRLVVHHTRFRLQ